MYSLFDKKFSLRHGKGVFIAYDHGIEHGPISDFKDSASADPLNILRLAHKAEVNGVILTPGMIIKYADEIRDLDLKVVVKINGKTSMSPQKYVTALLGDLDELFSLCENIYGFGYTIYFGSSFEADMITEFSLLRAMASAHDVCSVVWAYPRGENISKENDVKLLCYAARVAMELGADAIKIKMPDRVEDLDVISKYVYRTHIFVAGGSKRSDFLELAERIYSNKNVNGFIVGRNVWQDIHEGLRILTHIKHLIEKG